MTHINIIEKIKSEYPKNGFQKTANIIGISLYNLKKIIKDNEIILSDKERRVEFSNFEDINKKEVAYFLGFLWSDGYIDRNEIALSIKSDDSVTILNILNTFGKWRINYRIRKLNGKDFKQACIRVNDKKIKDFLLENDYGNKSLNTPSKILSKIPDNLKSYFFRGLIDGDGCFCSKNRSYFSITGTIEQDWLEIDNLLKNLGIKYTLTKKERKSGNSSYVVISSKKDITTLGNYIYGINFDNIGLNRKYIIYKEIIDKPISKYSRYN